MGAELIAWRPGRLVVIVALVAAMAIGVARWGGFRCGHKARVQPARSGLKITPPTWIMDDICGSLAELPSILAFDEPRMQRFCQVLSR